MKREELQSGWKGVSDEILEGVAHWREAHPRATMREIDDEIDKRLSELQAKMISDTANASERAEWASVQGVACPDCGAKLVKKGGRRNGFCWPGMDGR